MSDQVKEGRARLVERILNGPGVASAGARRAAFDNRDVDTRASALIGKVARNAWKVTDSDVAGAKTAGLSEDEIFELTVCAAIGQATRQMEAALEALDAAAPRDDVQQRAAKKETA
jgi:alkylhydroperoxidase/carboxymuconolactone decarboxylase family protein YurZ